MPQIDLFLLTMQSCLQQNKICVHMYEVQNAAREKK